MGVLKPGGAKSLHTDDCLTSLTISPLCKSQVINIGPMTKQAESHKTVIVGSS